MPEPAPKTEPRLVDVMKLWDAGHDTRDIGIRLNAPEWLIFGLVNRADRREAHVRPHQMKAGGSVDAS